MNCIQKVIPPLPSLRNRNLNVCRIAVTGNQLSSLASIIRLAEHKNQCLLFAWTKLEFRL